MPFSNTIKMTLPEPGYDSELWRAKHGYKEELQHDAPYRRSRDFKPVPYGSFKGMPNYRHAEPWAQLKNVKDMIINERDHHPTKWFKSFAFGALVGFTFGLFWIGMAPLNGFAAQKLMASLGNKPWSGRMARLASQTLGKYVLVGGSITLSY